MRSYCRVSVALLVSWGENPFFEDALARSSSLAAKQNPALELNPSCPYLQADRVPNHPRDIEKECSHRIWNQFHILQDICKSSETCRKARQSTFSEGIVSNGNAHVMALAAQDRLWGSDGRQTGLDRHAGEKGVRKAPVAVIDEIGASFSHSDLSLSIVFACIYEITSTLPLPRWKACGKIMCRTLAWYSV